jgi:hypothetical protein
LTLPTISLSLRLIAVAACVFLASCGRTESYRYKLTLAVNTPDGVKRGSTVGEVSFFGVSIPDRGVMHKLYGQALYLDLGPGRRPLIALLTSSLHPKQIKDVRWSQDGGPNLIFEMYGVAQSHSLLDDVSKIRRQRGPRIITASDLPDLVTFTDINDPKSVIEVDPYDLHGPLGPDISWNEITLESTNEPVTRGIEKKLTWLDAFSGGMLDGNKLHWLDSRKTLANSLSTADFRDPHYKKWWW